MKKPCSNCAPKVNSRPLFNFTNKPKTAIRCKEFFYKSDILKENCQKALKKDNFIFLSNTMLSVCYSLSFVCHVIRMPLVYILMSTECHSYVFVCYSCVLTCCLYSYVLLCHPYVTGMYSYFIRMSLVCTHMSSVCHSYILVCHPYVTGVCFYHEPTNFQICIRCTFKFFLK